MAQKGTTTVNQTGQGPPGPRLCSLESKTQYTVVEAGLGDSDGSQAGLDETQMAISVYNPAAMNLL